MAISKRMAGIGAGLALISAAVLHAPAMAQGEEEAGGAFFLETPLGASLAVLISGLGLFAFAKANDSESPVSP